MDKVNPLLIEVPSQIVGPRIKLSAYQPGDGAGLFEAIDNSREHILPWLPFGPSHQAPADSELYVRGSMARWVQRQSLDFKIQEKEDARILGACSLVRIDWNIRGFEIGYWIRHSAEGKGFVSEAVRLLAKMAFCELSATRLTITVASGNDRSAAVAKANGFVFEGAIRQSMRTEEGVIRDRLIFGQLREEWLEHTKV